MVFQSQGQKLDLECQEGQKNLGGPEHASGHAAVPLLRPVRSETDFLERISRDHKKQHNKAKTENFLPTVVTTRFRLPLLFCLQLQRAGVLCCSARRKML
jgi:hypothetical protein